MKFYRTFLSVEFSVCCNKLHSVHFLILSPKIYQYCLLLDVDLEMFLRFNKIRALVDNTELLVKALSKSATLEVTVHCSITCKLTEMQ